MLRCPWCGQSETEGDDKGPTWDHMCWTCPNNGRSAAVRVPDDPLQRRIGWASERMSVKDSATILAWMAQIRLQVRELVHRAKFFSLVEVDQVAAVDDFEDVLDEPAH